MRGTDVNRPAQTPAQTIGPFFHEGLLRLGVDDLDPNGVAGRRIELVGIVRDGDGAAVDDALVEIWQPDSSGRFRHPADGRWTDVPDGFIGFGRLATDAGGRFALGTVLPGTVPGPRRLVQAPHLSLTLFARGLLDQLATRVYFEGQEANDADPVLAAVPADRRDTLLARRLDEPTAGGHPRYRFDLVLQGPGETVFFDR